MLTHNGGLKMWETELTGRLITIMSSFLLFKEDITQQSPAVPVEEPPQTDTAVICNVSMWSLEVIWLALKHASHCGSGVSFSQAPNVSG